MFFDAGLEFTAVAAQSEGDNRARQAAPRQGRHKEAEFDAKALDQSVHEIEQRRHRDPVIDRRRRPAGARIASVSALVARRSARVSVSA